MDEELFLRLVRSFERIAEAVEDICVIQKRRYDSDYPEPRAPREAVVSRIKTEEDIAKERQGASDKPLTEWFGGFEDEEFIGVREKAFLEEERRRNASSEVQPEAGSGEGSAKKTRGRPKGR